MPITRVSPQLLKTGSNSALQITASNALTASYALNATAGGVTSIAAGDGLSGGTITSTGTISLNTSSVHFLDGVKKELNTEGVISSSTQFNSLTTPFTGSFTGSFRGTLTGTGSWADSSSRATSASFATTANTVLTNTVSYTAGAGLSGGGSATLGGGSVTIDAVAGAGISLTLPTNDAINIDTGSLHFISGARSSISVTDTAGASGIDLTYNTGTGVLSGTLVNSSVTVNGTAISLGGSGTVTANTTNTLTLGNGLTGTSFNGSAAVTTTVDTSSVHFLDGVKKELNTEGVISSSTQFSSLTSPFTGSFTGSFRGNLTGTSSWADRSTTSSFATTANTVLTNTVSYTAGAGLSGGGSATLGGGAVTIDAVAGAGISLTLPTNDAINIDTSSAHFTGGVKSKLNTDGVVSSSTQFNSLTAPFTGSFTGSFRGALTGTGSWADSSSRATSASFATTANTVLTNTVSYTAGAGLSGGGSATLGGGAVTIDAVAGAGISLTAPTNDAINIDTSSAHFTGGVKNKNNTDGVVSSSTQFTSLTAPFTGSFTGSHFGSLVGTSSWATTASFALSSAGGGSVTINNNTDNYVVTATGTASTLNGEVALQFDSTTRRLSVSGSISSSGDVFIRSGSGILLGGTATKQVSGGPEKISHQSTNTNSVLLWSGLTSDTEGRFLISANGFTEWGAGGTSDQDISFFRNNTGSLAVQSFNTHSLSTFVVYDSQSAEIFAVDTRAGNKRVRINNAAGGATLDLAGTSGLTAYRVTHVATGDTAFGSLVSGDGNFRFNFNTIGDLSWGPGSAGSDIRLRRSTTRNLVIEPVTSDTTSTFRVLNAAGSTVFNVDTTNTRIGVGTSSPTEALAVVGNVSASAIISSTSPVYNVKAYGAVGNGTTDDYTAISASIAAARSAGGGTIYLPKGRYRIGTGLRAWANINFKGDGRENTIIHCNHLSTLPGGAMISGSDISNVVIEDLCLSGSGINGASSIGIKFSLNAFSNTDQVVLRNLFVNDQAGDGINIATPILTTIQNVKVRYTAGDGFYLTNGTSTNLYECFAVTGLGAGFRLDTMTYCSLIGCASEVYGISYLFNNCSAISAISCGSEDPISRVSTNPGYSGIAFRNSETGTTSRVSLYSCYSRDPRTAAPSGHISGSFHTYNFRGESGSQVLTPFRVWGNMEVLGGSLSASLSSSGYINFANGLNVTGSFVLSGSQRIISSSLGVNVAPNATVGRIDASNDIVAFSSDRRLKTNATKLTNAVSKIEKIEGFTYNWNSLANTLVGYDTTQSYVGVYAQDVQSVLPEAVRLAPFDNDGHDNSISGQNYLTVQYEKLVPLLVEAVKELKMEVNELKRKINGTT